MFYQHERQERTERTELFNTRWPAMSTAGVDADDCKKYMTERKLSWTLAELNGWYPSRNAGDGFLRIVIPAKTTVDGAVYWQARAVSPNVHLRYQSPFGKRCGALVYVAANPEDGEETKELVVVEGPMDALAVAEYGYDAIALMGMQPGQDAKAHLAKFVENRDVAIILDSEPEAHTAAIQMSMYLAGAADCASVHVYEVPRAKDIASMSWFARQDFLKGVF